MNEAKFRSWLATVYRTAEGSGLDPRTQGSRLSNCKRVEQFEGDLDEHFERDRMASLLARLEYSKDEARRNRPPRHRIPIQGDTYTGTAALRSAVSLYRQYRESPHQHVSAGIAAPASVASRQRRSDRSVRQPWPTWPVPAEADQLRLARATAPYVRFLHPEIVEAVVADNEVHRPAWTAALAERGMDPACYLWERSACAFPGVRRYAGSREIAAYRGHGALPNEGPEGALRLDDNDFPKQVWSFVFRGAKFAKHGPPGYALAHLADHKAHGNRAGAEFGVIGNESDLPTPFGLYTSVANAAYMPLGLLRPTDFAGPLRNLLIRRAEQLYSEFCNLLPPGLQIRAPVSPAWELEQFEWPAPVGSMDHVPRFLEFRRAELERLIAARPIVAKPKGNESLNIDR